MIDVKRIQRKILDLAFDGKLTKSQSTDESVDNVLLQLKAKNLEEYNALYPQHWRVIKFSSFADIYTGDSTSEQQKKEFSKRLDNSIEYIATKDISMTGKVDYTNGMYIPNNGDGFKVAPANSILLCIEGANAGNKIAIIDRNVCFVNKLCCFSPRIINNKFTYYYLQSNKFRSSFMDNIQGIIGGVSIGKVRQLPVPIPPIQEQERIVTKIEELFAIVDRLAQDQIDVEKYKQLVRTKILDYIFLGKLSLNFNNSSTVDDLLTIIDAQKSEMIKSGIVKNKKYSIKETEYPYICKNDWTFDKLGNIAFITKLAGFEYTKYIANNLCKDGIPLFKGKNVQNGKVIYDFESYIPKKISDYLIRSKVQKKCLLTPYVGTIGNIGLHDKTGEFHLGSNVGKIELFNSPIETYSEELLMYYLQSSFGYKELCKHKKSTAQESISIDAIRDIVIPIIPIDEQKFLLEKIESMFALLDLLN